MRAKLWTAAAVALAVCGAAAAGEMKGGTSGGDANPAEKGVRTPTQPNETQPGQSAGTGAKGAMKGDGMKGSAKGEGMKSSSKGGGDMKADTMSTGSGSANPAEKGVSTPKQPNETQPGMGSSKK